MKKLGFKTGNIRFWFAFVLVVVAMFVGDNLQLRGATAVANALADVGYQDHFYKTSGVSEPTGEKPQSKLWYNDGKWWGSLFEPTSQTYHIYQLNWDTQAWTDTGVLLDDRKASKADMLWDGSKLYAVSGSASATVRLYRYSYSGGSYSLDSGYPVQIGSDTPVSVTMTKDSQNVLWITYVEGTKVYVAHSSGADNSWGAPYVIPTTNANGTWTEDMSAIVAYSGSIGVMWSHQGTATKKIYFAYHQEGAADSAWTEALVNSESGDNHINIKSLQSDPAGSVFAVVKTSYIDVGEPQIVLLACVTGNCSSAANWTASNAYIRGSGGQKTRPILLLDTDHREVYVFVTNTGGGNAYYKKTSYDTLTFADGEGTLFIDFSEAVNNVTSTKQNLNSSTGLVVLAAGSNNYYHNCLTLITGSTQCPDPNTTPVLNFSSATYNVDEAAASATITVVRSYNPNKVLTVNYSSSNATAVAGQDYTAVSGTLTFNSGETQKTFTVPVLNDSLDEENETLTLTLSNLVGDGLIGSVNPSTLTITDNDAAPTVALSSATTSASENAATATVTVNLSSASGKTVTVDYGTSDGTATSPDDYTGVASATLTFAPGQTSRTFNITIVNDNLFETDETVALALANPGNATLTGPQQATLTILNDDPPPTVQFATADFAVNENDGTATIEVALSSLSSLEITVDYIAVAGTAVADQDYTAVAPGTLTFAPAEGSQSFTIDISDDSVDEAGETISLILSNVQGTGASLGTPAEAAVTIADNDAAPSVQFMAATIAVDESAGPAVATVNLTAASERTITVEVASSDNDAAAGEDYTAVAQTLTFAPGEISQTVSTAILGDALDEADEDLTLTLSNGSNVSLGVQSTATVTITDDDDAPTLQFSSASYEVVEDGGSTAIILTLSQPSGQAIEVNLATSGGTATAGGDYQAVNKKVQFDPGDTVKTVDISIFDDSLSEDTSETVNLVLSSLLNGGLGTPGSATLIIWDDDSPELLFTSSHSVTEGNLILNLVFELSYAPIETAMVDYVTVNGSATANEDYMPVSGTLTFAPGETSKTIVVRIHEDIAEEGDESFTLVFSNPHHVLMRSNSVTITVLEDDAGGGSYMLYLPVIQR